jgi:hypothetical protein
MVEENTTVEIANLHSGLGALNPKCMLAKTVI